MLAKKQCPSNGKGYCNFQSRPIRVHSMLIRRPTKSEISGDMDQPLGGHLGQNSSDEPERVPVTGESHDAILTQRREFLGITESDQERVRALAPLFGEFADEFVEHFYKHLYSFPATSSYLQDPLLVQRLKHFQK